MPDVDNVKTRVTGYGLKSTIGELIQGLEVYLGREDDLKQSILWQTRQSVLDKLGVSFGSVEEENDFFESLGIENTIEQVLPKDEPEVQIDKTEEVRSLNSQDLKILLREYDKHRGEELDRIAEWAKNNPELRNKRVSDMVKVLQEKRALEIREEKLGNKNADRTSDQKLITESRLVEQGVETEKAKKLAELIVEKDKNEATVTRQDVINKTDEINKEEIVKILEVAKVAAYENKLKKIIDKTTIDLIKRVLPEEVEPPREIVVATKAKIEEMVLAGNFGKEETQSLGNSIALELRSDTATVNIAVERGVQSLQLQLENNEEVVRIVREQNVFDEVLAATRLENPVMNENQMEVARQYSRAIAQLPESGIRQFKEQSINQIVGTVDNEGKTIQVTYAGQLFDQFETATRVARSGESGIKQLIGVRKLMGNAGLNLPVTNDKARNVDKVMSLIEKDPGLAKVMGLVGKKIDAFNNFYNGLGYKVFAKVGGEKAVGWLATKIGGQAGLTIANEGLKIVAAKGLEAGLKSVFLKIATSVGLKIGATAGAGAAATATGLVAGLSNPIGWAITAIAFAGKFLVDNIKRGKKVLDNILSFLGISLPDIKGKMEDSFGKVGAVAVTAGGMLLAIPTMIGASLVTALIGPVIVFLIGGLMFYQIFIQGPQISSIKPPEGMGGGQCVLKSKQDELGGAINCNQNAPEVSYPGISKAQFVNLAGRWRTGKNYAEECYNDVVNRALCAGVSPVYALWVWVHESGASNYDITEVEDFGIHGQPTAPAKDFNAQINYFLTLDPGAYCMGDPMIGGDYWLGFATNFLNGSCDPDEPNKTSGQTGREYLETLKETWSWVSSDGMPNGIKIEAGGESCGSNEATGTYDFIDQSGNAWVCTKNTTNGGGIVPVFGEWDPNTEVPVDCPGIIPSSGYFSQGPFAQGCSHAPMNSPAIDIGAVAGTDIRATHNGVVQLNYDGIYGYYIDLHGSCDGKDFFTRYGHMPEGGYRVENGATVSRGDVIGVVDTTGSSTGNHLHYHITGLDTNKFGQYLGLSVQDTEQLWGCCNGDNGKYCPALR